MPGIPITGTAGRTAALAKKRRRRRSGRQVARDIEDAGPLRARGGTRARPLPPPLHRGSANAAISLELANDRAEVGGTWRLQRSIILANVGRSRSEAENHVSTAGGSAGGSPGNF